MRRRAALRGELEFTASTAAHLDYRGAAPQRGLLRAVQGGECQLNIVLKRTQDTKHGKITPGKHHRPGRTEHNYSHSPTAHKKVQKTRAGFEPSADFWKLSPEGFRLDREIEIEGIV